MPQYTQAGPGYLTEGRSMSNFVNFQIQSRNFHGLSLLASYNIRKTLVNNTGKDIRSRLPGTNQLQNPNDLNEFYSVALYEYPQNLLLNYYYELPFGRGKRFLNEGGAVDKIFGGFRLTTILRYGSGRPITIVDPRGTFNRNARSTRNTANSSLSKDEIKNLFGDFTRDGVRYYINPDVLLITRNADGSVTSLATRGPGQPTFEGQAFFNVPAGQVGNMERAIVNGPNNFNMDVGLSKRVSFGESTRYLEFRAEAFNVTNRNNFLLPLLVDINSTTFGQLSPSLSTQGQGLESPRRLQFAVRFEF
jgi:hypothetical protein